MCVTHTQAQTGVETAAKNILSQVTQAHLLIQVTVPHEENPNLPIGDFQELLSPPAHHGPLPATTSYQAKFILMLNPGEAIFALGLYDQSSGSPLTHHPHCSVMPDVLPLEHHPFLEGSYPPERGHPRNMFKSGKTRRSAQE